MDKAVPQRRRSAVEVVVDSIRDGIRSGRLNAGQRLIEADITETLAVSRGPVREAMRRLAAEGLVETELHKGARVRQMSRFEVLALFEIRRVLEGLAARLATRNLAAAPRLASRLRHLQSDMKTAMKNGRVQDYDRLNHQFHDLLVEASNNPHLPQLVRQLQTPVLRFQFRALFDRKEMADSFNGHTRIIAAVLKGDEAKAEREMQRHIERARAFILALPDDLFGRD